MNILQKIVGQRLGRIQREGAGQGLTLPFNRELPLVPFGKAPFLVCEIKRRSPSRGAINARMDPVKQAELYTRGGAANISVLTEQDHFGGSLADLMAVKRNFPGTSILRKDFLLSREDLDISFRAGADAFLLIASILPGEILEDLYHYGQSLGLTPLVELHDREDVEKAARFKPSLVGINCRDLKTFTIDLYHPLKLKNLITWPCAKVYESGIHSVREGAFALGCGFEGLLVGESVVRNPEKVKDLTNLFSQIEKLNHFYRPFRELYARKKQSRPLIKICGITRIEDARTAVREGADMLGFILADSPRKVTPDFIRACDKLPVLKAGVVVLDVDMDLPREIGQLLEEGSLDFIQFHGNEQQEILSKYPGYKALRMRDEETLLELPLFTPPAVLLDAWVPQKPGGTGTRISEDLMEQIKKKPSLWLAGGLAPENIRQVTDVYCPDLVDLSSGLETSPGIKDPERIRELFSIITNL